ncbi:MAG TPA: hypothetical protein VG387_19630 [Rhizomicrobium sp.]|jgi:predicted Fe-S protein YdhL (DUF1289 family)|nr:hypothetical protein [Rhizomicrobium sp.]
MALFPKIQSPCPYKNDISALMDGDMCRMCHRQVVDISNMSDAQRVSLIAGCQDEICVSYRLPALSAVALAVAVVLPTAAAACDAVPETIVMGGIKDTQHVTYVHVGDKSAPALPVVYEDAAPPAKPAPAGPTKDGH